MTKVLLTRDALIKRFFSSKGLYVPSLTGKLITQLIALGYDDPAKIFGLTESVVIPLEGVSEKTITCLIADLEEARYTTLPRLLYALGFPGDDALRYAMLRHHPTWYALSWAACFPLTHIQGFTEKALNEVKAFFTNPARNNLVIRLRDQGVNWDKMVFPPEGPLYGKHVVITGSLCRFTRAEATDLICLHGGRVSDMVSSKTDYLLVGERPGSKLAKAQALDIDIIDESTWLSWVL